MSSYSYACARRQLACCAVLRCSAMRMRTRPGLAWPGLGPADPLRPHDAAARAPPLSPAAGRSRAARSPLAFRPRPSTYCVRSARAGRPAGASAISRSWRTDDLSHASNGALSLDRPRVLLRATTNPAHSRPPPACMRLHNAAGDRAWRGVMRRRPGSSVPAGRRPGLSRPPPGRRNAPKPPRGRS